MGANEQREEGAINPIELMGFSDWHTSNIENDNNSMDEFLDFIKRTYFNMNAAQMKSFLFSAIREIDKRAHI